MLRLLCYKTYTKQVTSWNRSEFVFVFHFELYVLCNSLKIAMKYISELCHVNYNKQLRQ